MNKSRWYPYALCLLLVVSAMACRRPTTVDPLAGTLWVATSCLGKEPLAGTTLTLFFEAGQVKGSSGCNTYFGSYRVTGERIVVEQLASTKMACQAQGVMQQEGAFLASLGEAQTFRLEEGRLDLVRADGQTLVFKPGE